MPDALNPASQSHDLRWADAPPPAPYWACACCGKEIGLVGNLLAKLFGTRLHGCDFSRWDAAWEGRPYGPAPIGALPGTRLPDRAMATQGAPAGKPSSAPAALTARAGADSRVAGSDPAEETTRASAGKAGSHCQPEPCRAGYYWTALDGFGAPAVAEWDGLSWFAAGREEPRRCLAVLSPRLEPPATGCPGSPHGRQG